MSKGLDALKLLVLNLHMDYNTMNELNNAQSIIENELKALEIVKEKQVNVREMKYWFGLKSEQYEFTYQEYCRVYNDYKDDYDTIPLSEKMLTEEEFNLLKEVLL